MPSVVEKTLATDYLQDCLQWRQSQVNNNNHTKKLCGTIFLEFLTIHLDQFSTQNQCSTAQHHCEWRAIKNTFVSWLTYLNPPRTAGLLRGEVSSCSFGSESVSHEIYKWDFSLAPRQDLFWCSIKSKAHALTQNATSCAPSAWRNASKRGTWTELTRRILDAGDSSARRVNDTTWPGTEDSTSDHPRPSESHWNALWQIKYQLLLTIT